MANDILQSALHGGQPLRGRRQGRYRQYYQEQQDPVNPEGAPIEEAPVVEAQPAPVAEEPTPIQPTPINAALMPRANRTQGRERWNADGGPINRLYSGRDRQVAENQPAPASVAPPPQAPPLAAEPPPVAPPVVIPPPIAPPVAPQPPRIFKAQNGQMFLIDDDGSHTLLQTSDIPVVKAYVASVAPPPPPAPVAPETSGAPTPGGQKDWRGFTNQGGDWGGGKYNPDAIQQGPFESQLEGFNSAKFDPTHADNNSLKYVFAKAASGVDVKQKGATQAVVDRLKAMGVNAAVENADGEADRIIFLDTGESIDVMRGGANVGQAAWQWIDPFYDGVPAGGPGGAPGAPVAPVNPTVAALAPGGVDSGSSDPGQSTYLLKLLDDLKKTNPALHAQLVGQITPKPAPTPSYWGGTDIQM